ncbi:MAG: DUF5368 family protein, partial [Paracoccus sp. (in: a-proteobacteria)]|nr:DUF5368 family protein [Paracoccus sp. (in: a-proteobacteria)]
MIAAIIVTVAYLFVLFCDRSLSLRKFFWAQVSTSLGAIVAVLFVQGMTSPHFRDIGGPIDVIVLLGVAVLGAVGMAIVVYTLQSLLRRPH